MISCDTAGSESEPAITVTAKTTFLTPAFELSRAKELHLPVHPFDVVTWEEHEDPFVILADFLRSSSRSPTCHPHYSRSRSRESAPRVIADDELRLFIAQGLAGTGVEIVPYEYTSSMALVKQIKSPREVAILGAVNTLTVEAIRAVQRCAMYGMSELALSSTVDEVMRSAGLEPFCEFFHAVLNPFRLHAACC